jgi:hypothetical protein|tara:strand:+ start:3203 stop:3637 length:435 start_codon:yes stop_codon:yes gene_type:complete
MKSLYETFGNEVNYEVRRDKVVQFLENSTINFPLPEASVDILTNMLDQSDSAGIDATRIDMVKGRLEEVGFNKVTANTLAVALIKIAQIQGVHPISYFELNEDSIKLAENTYKALNKIRPKGNLVGLSVEKKNKFSKISDLIRP